jgi:ABC-2 type transport system permease protein
MRASLVIGIRRIFVLARAEVLHVVRDRATVAQIIIMPLVQLLVLSNVATFAVRSTPAYLVDYDRTSTSRGIASHLEASGWFDVVGQSASPDSAQRALLGGDVTMVMTIPREFERDLVHDGNARVQLEVNAAKGSAAGIAEAYVQQILTAYAAELSPRIHPTLRTTHDLPEVPPVASIGTLDIRTRGWYNAQLDYKRYMVPAILVALVTVIGSLLTAQNLAREKEAGTIEQLNVTPISRAQFITAKLLPFWVLALLDLVLGLIVGRFVLGVQLRGSPLLLMACAAVYLIVPLGIGLWISTLVETQQQAMFVNFFLTMIYLLMSGLFTPIDSMPHWLQVASILNPVRHFVTISRGILIRGAGLAEIGQPLAILAVYGAVVLTLAVRQYHKTSV